MQAENHQILRLYGRRPDMLYRTCEYCGAHLDPGEPCDCRNGGAATDIQYKTKNEEEEADDIGAEH